MKRQERDRERNREIKGEMGISRHAFLLGPYLGQGQPKPMRMRFSGDVSPLLSIYLLLSLLLSLSVSVSLSLSLSLSPSLPLGDFERGSGTHLSLPQSE